MTGLEAMKMALLLSHKSQESRRRGKDDLEFSKKLKCPRSFVTTKARTQYLISTLERVTVVYFLEHYKIKL